MGLGELILPLWKKWWLILICMVVAVAFSLVAIRRQPPAYEAKATMVVGRALESLNPSNNDLWLTQQLANTYADMARREPVQEAVKAALGLTWLPTYDVHIVPNTPLIEIVVADTDPARAQAVTNEIAQQLTRLGPAGADQENQPRQAFVNEQLDELEASIESTREEIERRQAELGGMFSARQIADTETQIGALQAKLASLQANYATLLQSTAQGATNRIDIFSPATLPAQPVGPNETSTIALAAAVGLMLSSAAAYLMHYLDDTVKSASDVQKVLELPTLGSVPKINEVTNKEGKLYRPVPAAMEAYNVLRTNLLFAAVERPIRSLLITSPASYEGKSLTVAHLGMSLAMAGQRVILVDGDLRSPQLHRLFGLDRNTGVTSALLQERPDARYLLQPTEVPGLHVLTAGPLPPNPPALLGSTAMRRLLAALGEEADIVIMDGPPALPFADAAIMSTEADGVLLVLNAGKTRREMARRTLENLNRVHAHVFGVVLNRIPMRGSEYNYYRRYYRNHKAPAQTRNGSKPEGVELETIGRGRSLAHRLASVWEGLRTQR